MHTQFYVITKIGLWALWTPEQKWKIRNMINYQCQVVLKAKANQLLRRNKTFFAWILCGSSSGQCPHGILVVEAGARLVKTSVLETGAIIWWRHLSGRSRRGGLNVHFTIGCLYSGIRRRYYRNAGTNLSLKYYMTHSYVESNFKKWYKWTYLQNKNRPTDIENKFTVTKAESGEGMGIN